MKRLASLLTLLLTLAMATPAWAEAPFDPFARTGIDHKADARVPMDAPLRDAEGRETTLRALAAGKPLLLAPVLHDCPNICGVTLSGLAQAVRAQEYEAGRDFAVVAFGIDPREGDAQASAALHALGEAFPALTASGGIHATTGAAETIAAITDAIGYRFAYDERIGQYAHVAAVAVLTADGRLARWLYGVTQDPTDLHLALTEAGRGEIGGWTDQLLLLCYHYDPATGTYGSTVRTLLRVGGCLTVLGLGGFVVLAVRRDRRSASERSGSGPA